MAALSSPRPTNILAWERRERAVAKRRLAEVRAEPLEVGDTGITLSGYADRIDLLPADHADILDYKTGSSPSKAQAHTLIAPQLALEGALLMRGVVQGGRASWFRTSSPMSGCAPTARSRKSRSSNTARRCARPKRFPPMPGGGSKNCCATTRIRRKAICRASLPFREGEMDGDYDHLARVLEWSAGGDDEPGEAE